MENKGRSLAMVYPVRQYPETLYDPKQALRRGTLFPELDKPMNAAASPARGVYATEKQSVSFAAWEMRLYLDTHPDDRQALALFERLCGSINGAAYPCAFVKTGADRWRWIDDPWPWENADNVHEEGEDHVCV